MVFFHCSTFFFLPNKWPHEQTWCQSAVRTQSCVDGPRTAVSSVHLGPDEIWLVQFLSESCIPWAASRVRTESGVGLRWFREAGGKGGEDKKKRKQIISALFKVRFLVRREYPSFTFPIMENIGNNQTELWEKMGIWSKTSTPEHIFRQHWRREYLKWRFLLSGSQHRGASWATAMIQILSTALF